MKAWTLLLAMLFPIGIAAAAPIDGDDRDAVLSAIIKHLNREYVLPEEGKRAAAKLERARRSNDFRAHTEGKAFAEALTRTLREVSGDGHLAVEYSEKPLSAGASLNKEFTAQEMERYYGPQVNHGVKKVERLDQNVGLLELTVFPPSSMGGATIAAALNVIAQTDALIIDLRNNGGGSDTVTLVASYLFDERRPLSGIYNRARNELTQHYTQQFVPGARFGGAKPVYVLISKRTFSAAEALAYDLQALKRATIIGAPSGGGAHPFEYQQIHPHFVLWSVTQRSLNPVTGSNWQGTGVIPDVAVEPAQALDKALEMIRASRSP